MGLYIFCLCIGFGGLVVMGLLGHMHLFGRHSHGHAHVSHGHTPHGHADHVQGVGSGFKSIAQVWMSPRVLFSLVFAFGATGFLLRHLLPATAVLLVALVAAFMFERWLVQPIWRVLFGFASNPARTLESAILEEAEAVTNFDPTGHGVVAVNLDGQVVQLLGALQRNEREVGVRIRAGDRVTITAVDPRRNSCTVIRLPLPADQQQRAAARE